MPKLNRIDALRNILHAKKIDAFLTTHLPNVRYLTGFSGSNALLLVTQRRSFFLTDFRYKEQVTEEVSGAEIVVGQGSLLELASKKRIFNGVQSVAYENNYVSVSVFNELAKKIGNNRLSGTEGIVEGLRSVKDDEELRYAKRAIEITDMVFGKILGILKPGMREIDVSAEISYLHKKYGSEKDAFDTIVASGVRSSLPHGTASDKKIGNHEFVTLDFGCIVHGYHSDMTRTVCIGTPTKEMRTVYTIVKDAQEKGLDIIRAGIAASAVDAAARTHIARKGYGEYFGHSLGHGVGLEIHEKLRLAASNTSTLKNGNLVTVEPGIYLPNKFGVRIEDVVVVRDNGCEILTASPKELIVL